MIHSPGSMPTGNFDEPAVPPPPLTVSKRSFRLPADYYAAPLAEVRPIFPAWVPWGCGGAAALFLVILFAGGALLTGPRLAGAIDLVLGMTLGELKGMYTPQVTEDQKAAFDGAVETMREDLRQAKIGVQDVQPFLQAVQRTVGDQKVTPAEVERLTEIARKAAKPSPASAPAD